MADGIQTAAFGSMSDRQSLQIGTPALPGAKAFAGRKA